MQKNVLKIGVSILAFAVCQSASAQVVANDIPPLRPIIDGNGINLTIGLPESLRGPVVTSGADKELVYAEVPVHASWQPLGQPTINFYTNKITIAFKDRSESFDHSVSSTSWTSVKRDGASLSFVSDGVTNPYTLTDRDGNKYVFESIAYFSWGGNPYYLTSETRANGLQKLYSYSPGLIDNGTSDPDNVPRLTSIDTNTGYKFSFTYETNSMTNYGNIDPWLRVKSVRSVNRTICAFSPCSTSESEISFSRTLATPNNVVLVTDTRGNQWRYAFNNTAITAIRRPGDATDTVSIAYSGGRVSSVTTPDGVWGYNFSLSGTTMTATVTNPLSKTKIYVIDTAIAQPTSITDENGKITSYQYDSYGRNTRITYPEGNYVQLTYDARGNVTQTTKVAKSGSGLASISTSASFDAVCANQRTCNQPNSTTDERGNVADYTYDATHGGALTVTAPAAATGQVRPQTRFSYIPLYAWTRLGNGTYRQATLPVYKLTGTSTCASGSTCAGTAAESKTAIAYEVGSASVPSNILPVSSTMSAGDGSVTATTTYAHDEAGNVISIDGPLAGTADTSSYRYDAARQLVGIIAPDPDGAGGRNPQAQRFTYNVDGQVTASEVGSVNGTTDTDWTAFVSAQQRNSTYSRAGHETRRTVTAGGAAYRVADFGYDAAGRLVCTAERMNSTTWDTATDACTLQATGTTGPDRVVKNSYDDVGRITKVQTGYGVTGVQADEVTTAYTNNGRVDYVIDAENNRTEYSYDGHDRLVKTEYPSATKGANAANAADYEQLGYDVASNVTSRRLRDGTSISYGYDNLNRLVSKDLPGSEPDASYSYDLMGRPIGATQDAQTLTFVYDALGRKIGESIGYLGATAYAYDAAGRRTSMTYPGGGLVVSYDYDTTGNVTAIRENGATSGEGVLATYAFDDLGRRTSVTFGNGSVQSFAYDPVSRLATLTNDLGGAATTYDLTQTFSYNPANQIASATRSNDAYAWQAHYNVDRSYVADGLNRIMNAGSTVFGYDARGNLTSDGTNSYGYTAENMLATGPGSAALSYDPAGRLKRTYSSALGATWYGYDGVDLTSELDSVGNVLRRYVHGPGTDNPIAWYEGSGISSTTRRFLMADERGSIVSVTDSAGATLNINAYDEYGIPAPGNLGRFGYTGQTWLPELGMWYYKARIYSPTLGRFMQTDPVGYSDGMNWYDYVGSDPINGVDPSGLNGLCPVAGELCVTGTRSVPMPGHGSGGSGSLGGFAAATWERQAIPQAPALAPAEEIVVTGQKFRRIVRHVNATSFNCRITTRSKNILVEFRPRNAEMTTRFRGRHTGDPRINGASMQFYIGTNSSSSQDFGGIYFTGIGADFYLSSVLQSDEATEYVHTIKSIALPTDGDQIFDISISAPGGGEGSCSY